MDLLQCNFNRLNETLFGPGECVPEDLDWCVSSRRHLAESLGGDTSTVWILCCLHRSVF